MHLSENDVLGQNEVLNPDGIGKEGCNLGVAEAKLRPNTNISFSFSSEILSGVNILLYIILLFNSVEYLLAELKAAVVLYI